MTKKMYFIVVSIVALLCASQCFAQAGPPGGVSGNVTVINPATNPVINSNIDNPGRHAFAATCLDLTSTAGVRMPDQRTRPSKYQPYNCHRNGLHFGT